MFMWVWMFMWGGCIHVCGCVCMCVSLNVEVTEQPLECHSPLSETQLYCNFWDLWW